MVNFFERPSTRNVLAILTVLTLTKAAAAADSSCDVGVRHSGVDGFSHELKKVPHVLDEVLLYEEGHYQLTAQQGVDRNGQALTLRWKDTVTGLVVASSESADNPSREFSFFDPGPDGPNITISCKPDREGS